MTSTSTSVPSIVSPSPNKKATAKSPRKRQKTEDKDSSKQQRQYHPPKEDWESIYRLVEELRADRTAPVDTDGSEALPQKHLGPQVYRFQVLIALMLSSQTKDAVVGDAMHQLQQHGLTVANIRNNTSFDQLNQLIGKVGFHNTKAKNILAVAEILDTHYGGDIPPTAQEMIDQLPGVGPKMAYIVENVAWGKQSGIGVDTHMHRMFNQLHWVNSKQPEQTRLQLESWLPREYWPTVNLLWVGLGQEVQQYQDKLLRKALDCSQPQQALKLLKRLGMDYNKVASKMGWTQELATHVGKGGH
jgi:endonuclease-3